MDKQAYIFIGHSGSGKGTQARLLGEKIKEKYSSSSLFQIETGSIFREFIKSSDFTAQKTKEYMDEGRLPPAFIGIHVWSHQLISNYNNQRFVLIDGTPRISTEVPVLLSAAKFYNWNLNVIYLEISDKKSDERLARRGREDDREESDRLARIVWFNENVMPAIADLKNNEEVNFIVVDGEKTIEEIHLNICQKLNI